MIKIVSGFGRMNFKEALKYITGEKRLKRAEEWMKRFIEAIETKYAEEKKFLKKWFASQNDLDLGVAGFFRLLFIKWKKEEKSRSAKASGQHPKRRTHLKKESEDLIKTVIREGQH